MQPSCRADGACCRSQAPQASGRNWILRFWQKAWISFDKHVHHAEQISFRQCITFNEHRQLKGWQPHFQPSVANSSISTILHWFVVFVTWKHGADFCKMPKQMALQTTNQKVWSKLHCDRHEHELLGSSEACKIWVQKIYGEKSFQSITDSQLQHRPWRCSSWIVTPNSIIHLYWLSDLFMSWISLQ